MTPEIMQAAPNYERREVQDPSTNVISLVGNVKENLEAQLKLTRDFFDQKLQLMKEASAIESNRIDACRRDDTEAVKVAQAAQEKRAEVLAAQLLISAETLRSVTAKQADILQAATTKQAETLQASTTKQAETLATQLVQMTTSLDARLKIVEEKQYGLAGQSKGSREMWGWITSGVVALIGIATFIITQIANQAPK